MMVGYSFGSSGNLAPLRLAQAWAMERLISFDCASGDLRWAIIALALRSFTAVWAFGQKQLLQSVRNVAGRVGLGACLAADMNPADSMVAAGGS